MSLQTKLSAVILSRGSTWNPRPDTLPYLFAFPGQEWPSGTAVCKFYDSAGAIITEVDGEVEPSEIRFNAEAETMDVVPQGANFEIFIETDDGETYQIRYGKVIRKEAEFFSAPAVTTRNQALRFVDDFPTLGLRHSWENALPGAPKPGVYDNLVLSLPYAVGAVQGLFGSNAAMRWYAPMNSDTVRVGVNLLNQGAGKTRVIVAADQRFTSFVGVEFDSAANKIHFCTGNGSAINVIYRGTEISNTVVDGDNYRIYYNRVSNEISLLKNSSDTPLGEWVDDTEIVPHGPGYTYTGLSWSNPALSQGVQVAYWVAQDEV
jgi:hypothetical protein